MKYLLVVALLFSGCNIVDPLEVGDCVAIYGNDSDRWEGVLKFLVLGVGEYSYRVELVGDSIHYESSIRFKQRWMYDRIDCPARIK